MSSSNAAAPIGAPTLETQAEVKNGTKRLIFTLISIVLQVVAYLILFLFLESYDTWIMILVRVVAVVLVLAIYSQDKTSAMKVPWMVLIMTVPVLGVLLYLFIGFNGTSCASSHRSCRANPTERKHDTFSF